MEEEEPEENSWIDDWLTKLKKNGKNNAALSTMQQAGRLLTVLTHIVNRIFHVDIVLGGKVLRSLLG